MYKSQWQRKQAAGVEAMLSCMKHDVKFIGGSDSVGFFKSAHLWVTK